MSTTSPSWGMLWLLNCSSYSIGGRCPRVQQTVVVEPPDPLQGGKLDIVEPSPRPAPPDHLRLVKPDDRLGQGVVVAIAPASDRRLDARFG